MHLPLLPKKLNMQIDVTRPRKPILTKVSRLNSNMRTFKGRQHYKVLEGKGFKSCRFFFAKVKNVFFFVFSVTAEG